MKSFTTVIFDLDGTLLDSLEDLADATNEVLASFGYPGHDYAAYRRYIGDGVNTLFGRVLPDGVATPDRIAACVLQMQTVYGRNWNRKSHPYDGILDLLDELTRRGLALAVLSNKPQEATARCVREFFPHTEFHPVFGQRDGVPRKPDPAGAIEILNALDTPPARCLYLGDTSIDMQTARAAGVLSVGVLWGFRTREDLVAGGATELIAEPHELLRLL